MILALVGLAALGALVVGTLNWQRQARIERRIDQMEEGIGHQLPDASAPKDRHVSMWAKLRSLEIRIVVAGMQIDTIRKRLRR